MKKIYLFLFLFLFLFLIGFVSCGKSPDPRNDYDAIQEFKKKAEQGSKELNQAIPK